jgi:probable FeS assembly SUF system protein SufT
MGDDRPITLARDCAAIMIPTGERVTLAAGSKVWLTQARGGGFTLMTEHGHMARVDGGDADALGVAATGERGVGGAVAETNQPIEEQIWYQLRSCFDPEIPVNIVDLGLIYECRAEALQPDGYQVTVRFTLTAQGCGMGQFLKEEISKKLLSIPGVRAADVALVWEPPWNQSMISPSAKHQLGIE